MRIKYFYLGCVFFFAAVAAAKFAVPPLQGAVNDRAGILTVSEKRLIESGLQNFRQSGGAQFAILTIDDLDGTPIEQAAIEVVDQWKLGGTKTDDGALLLISKKDRAIRIEVGQGLEGSLTDIASKRIIEDIMIPLFRAGQIGEGIINAFIKMAELTNPGTPIFQGQKRDWSNSRSVKSGRDNLFSAIILILFILFSFFGRSRRSFLYGLGMGNILGGGGFGRSSGGFGGFGGFSGGGGGFSGGGASGRW